MAEPLSALPHRTAPKPEAIESARTAEPLAAPESIAAQSRAEKLAARLGSGFGRSYSQVSGAIGGTWERSRRKFRYISHEHPLRLVFGVAVVAFIAGAALRIWRSNHD